jgi:hypothetical protein
MRVSFRGTVLDERGVARIQRLIDSGHCGSRQALAREVCRLFGWRRPNGAWAVRGARQLLIGLANRGAVVGLPAPRRVQGRAALAAQAQGLGWPRPASAMPALARGSRPALVVRPVEAGELGLWRAHMERYHYLGDAALVGESLRYVALLDGEVVALLSWGAAVLHNGPRDRYVGWDAEKRRANLHLVVNNARFLMLPSAQRPHLASRVLAANLRRLSRDWQAVTNSPKFTSAS